MSWRIVFDGTAYVALWGENAGVFAARIDERGNVIGQPDQLSTFRSGSPFLYPTVTVATVGGTTLAAWIECSSTAQCDLFVRRLDRTSVAQSVSRFATAQPPFYREDISLDSAISDGRIVIAYRRGSADFIDVLVWKPQDSLPTTATRVPVDPSQGSLVGSNGSRLLFLWGRMVFHSQFVEGCCFVPEPAVTPATSTAVPTDVPTSLVTLSDMPTSVGTSPWGDFVLTSGNGEWSQYPATLIMLSPEGTVRDRIRLPFLLLPATASFGDMLYVTARTNHQVGVGDLYLTGLRQSDDASARGFYAIHTSTMTDHSKLTAGKSTLLTSYELVGPVGQRGIAYQIVDPSALPPLPPAPAAPSIVSSTPGYVDQTTIAWDPVASATRYRLQVEVVQGYGLPLDRIIDSGTLSAVVPMYPDYDYRVGVVAEDANGRSPSSAITVFHSPAFGAPRAPSNASVSLPGDNTVTISWADNSANETGFRITGWFLHGPPALLATVPANTQHANLPLPPDLSSVTVISFNESGGSEESRALVRPGRGRGVRH